MYQRACGRHENWVKDISEYVWTETQKPVLPIVQAFDLPQKNQTRELENAIIAGLSANGSQAVIVFNLEHLNEAKLNTMINVIKTH